MLRRVVGIFASTVLAGGLLVTGVVGSDAANAASRSCDVGVFKKSSGYHLSGSCSGTGYVKFTYFCVNIHGGGYYKATGWHKLPASYYIAVTCAPSLGINTVPDTHTAVQYSFKS